MTTEVGKREVLTVPGHRLHPGVVGQVLVPVNGEVHHVEGGPGSADALPNGGEAIATLSFQLWLQQERVMVQCAIQRREVVTRPSLGYNTDYMCTMRVEK